MNIKSDNLIPSDRKEIKLIDKTKAIDTMRPEDILISKDEKRQGGWENKTQLQHNTRVR
jgi:hypothetical protein